MSNLTAFSWGALGGGMYTILWAVPAIREALRGEASFVFSSSRVTGFLIIVGIQCGLAGLMALLLVGGSREHRPLVALFVGLAWVSLISTLARSGLQDRSPAPLASKGETLARSDAVRRYFAAFTSERITATAAVVTALVAILAYITG